MVTITAMIGYVASKTSEKLQSSIQAKIQEYLRFATLMEQDRASDRWWQIWDSKTSKF